MPVGEQLIKYGARPVGSVSKLRTVSDGIRIARVIVVLVKDERPLQFFSAASFIMLAVALLLGFPVIAEFLKTGLVPRFPTAILSASLVLLSFLTLSSGLILDTISRGRREMRRLAYLSYPSPITVQQIKSKSMGVLQAAWK